MMNRISSAAAVVLCALSSACSSPSGSEVNDGTTPPNSGPPAIELTGTSGNGSSSHGSAKSCLPLTDDSGCVGEQYAGETVPLDVYILFDQSCSMSCPISRGGPNQCCTGGPDPRIVPLRAALDAFLRAPESAGIGFGIGYFGGAPAGQTSCSASDYQRPAVSVAGGQTERLIASIARAEPTGETPTGAALRGACSYAQGVKRAQPSHSVVILLVTDGIPETPVTHCGASLPDAVKAAAECANDAKSPIKTYVLGVGQALSNLNQIASSGRTNRAYLVEGGDVTASILSALNTIRGDAVIPCQLKIPPPPTGSSLDFSAVNVGVCDASGATQTTYNVAGPAQCADGRGWYYDDPANPQRIVLCKASCDTVSVPGAQLFYSVGCATQSVVR